MNETQSPHPVCSSALLDAMEKWIDAKLKHHWRTHHTGLAGAHKVTEINEARTELENAIRQVSNDPISLTRLHNP